MDKIELHLPAPPVKLSTNHRRRAHWNDINELTERAKLIYGSLIKSKLGKDYPKFDYARVTFELIVSNFKVVDPDNLPGATKPILDSITERSGIIGLLPDDSGKYVEVAYRIVHSSHKRKPWLRMRIEEVDKQEVSISPDGVKDIDW